MATFHDQPAAMRLLLEHGADPGLANSFGHTSYDLAKDQMASDERTVLRDKGEVRRVLEEHDASRAPARLFGDGDVKVSADGAAVEALPDEGTGVAMQVEMAADASLGGVAAAKKLAGKAKKKGAKKKGAKKK